MSTRALLCIIATSVVIFAFSYSAANADGPTSPAADISAPAAAENFVAATVLLTADQGVCGSGFLIDRRRIITNAHVTRSLCPAGRCDRLRALRAPQIGSPADHEIGGAPYTLRLEMASLDFAIIDLGTAVDRDPPFRLAKDARQGDKLEMLGFPGCGPLRGTAGEIITRDRLRLFTSVMGSHGSSGSPVFRANGEVLGIADQAPTIAVGLSSLLFGTTFASRALPAELIVEASTAGEKTPILSALAELSSFYSETVASTNDRQQRLRLALELLARVNSLGEDALRERADPYDLRPIFSINSGLPLLLRLPWRAPMSPLAALADTLAFQTTLETKGWKSSGLRHRSEEEIRNLLLLSGRSPEHAERIFELIRARGFDSEGIEMQIALVATPWILLALLIATLWSASLGYVFALARGGLFRRIFITFLVGIALWPLSLLIFLFRRRSATRRAVTAS